MLRCPLRVDKRGQTWTVADSCGRLLKSLRNLSDRRLRYAHSLGYLAEAHPLVQITHYIGIAIQRGFTQQLSFSAFLHSGEAQEAALLHYLVDLHIVSIKGESTMPDLQLLDVTQILIVDASTDGYYGVEEIKQSL